MKCPLLDKYVVPSFSANLQLSFPNPHPELIISPISEEHLPKFP